MNLRNCQYAEDLTPSTTSGSAAKAQLQFTGTQGDTYYMLALATIGDMAGSLSELTVQDNIGTDTYDAFMVPNTVTDYYNWLAMRRVTLGAGSPNFDFQIYGSGNGGAATMTIRDTHIWAFKELPTDVRNDAFGVGGGTVTATTYTDVGDSDDQVTFTATVGDYILWVAANIGNTSTTANNFAVKIDVDGVAYGEGDFRAVTTNASRGIPYCFHRVIALTAGSHTVKMQAKVTTSGTAEVGNLGILLVRADTFAAVRNQESLTEDANSTSTYESIPATPLTIRAQAQPTIIFGSALVRRGGNPMLCRMLEDGSTELEVSQHQSPIAAAQQSLFAMRRITTPTVKDYTWTLQHRTNGTGITSSFIEHAAVTAIQEKDDATVRILGATILGATIL